MTITKPSKGIDKTPEVKIDKAPDLPTPSVADPFYATSYGGDMIDFESQVVYSGSPKQGPLTGWLKHQLDCKTIKVVTPE